MPSCEQNDPGKSSRPSSEDSSGSPRASKRIKADEREVTSKNPQAAAASRSPRRRSRRVKLKTMKIAAQWQRDGHPGTDFLNQLGLGSLTTVDWTLSDPSLASSVHKFIINYNSEVCESEVDGRVIKLTPEMISRALQLPNEGIGLHMGRKRLKSLDRLNLFKEGAHNSQGFNHELARDPSHARILSLLGETFMFKPGSMAKYTSSTFLEWISEAMEGRALNWAGFICENLRSKLQFVQENAPPAKQAGLFPGSPWIAEILKRNPEQQQPEAPLALVPGSDQRDPVKELLLASPSLSDALVLLANRAEEQEGRIRALTRELEEANRRGEASLERIRELEGLIKEKNQLVVVERGGESQGNRLEIGGYQETIKVLDEHKERIHQLLGMKAEANRLELELSQALEKKCSSLQLHLDSIVGSNRSPGSTGFNPIRLAEHFHILTAGR